MNTRYMGVRARQKERQKDELNSRPTPRTKQVSMQWQCAVMDQSASEGTCIAYRKQQKEGWLVG